MAVLVAWLVSKGLPGWLSELIIWAVLIVVIWLVALYFWESKIHHPYVQEGKTAQLKIDQPLIAREKNRADLAEQNLAIAEKNFNVAKQANDDLLKSIDGPGGLSDQVKDSKQALDALTKVANQARAQSRAMLARIKDDAAEISRLRDLANGAPVVEKVCETADTVLSELAKWRLTQ